MIERIVDLAREPVVGKFYLVPTVRGRWCHYENIDWPVLLPCHEDEEHIGFGWLHYHHDPRFFPHRIWNVRTQGLDDALAYQDVAGMPLMSSDMINAEGLPKPVWRRRKCLRAMPERNPMRSARWFSNLESAFDGQRLKPGMICPHKGVCLKGVTVIDGVVQCPAHGLRWDVETGALVIGSRR